MGFPLNFRLANSSWVNRKIHLTSAFPKIMYLPDCDSRLSSGAKASVATGTMCLMSRAISFEECCIIFLSISMSIYLPFSLFPHFSIFCHSSCYVFINLLMIVYFSLTSPIIWFIYVALQEGGKEIRPIHNCFCLAGSFSTCSRLMVNWP